MYAMLGTDISGTIQSYKGGFKNYCSAYVVQVSTQNAACAIHLIEARFSCYLVFWKVISLTQIKTEYRK